MKLKISIIAAFLFLSSCTMSEKPEFIKLDDVEIGQSNSKEIILNANVYFLNKNSVGGTLKIKNIDVFVDNVAVAKVNSNTFEVPKKEEFMVPITVNIPYDKIFKKNKENLLDNVLNLISKKEIDLQYKGEITYFLGKLSYDYDLNYIDKVKLRK